MPVETVGVIATATILLVGKGVTCMSQLAFTEFAIR